MRIATFATNGTSRLGVVEGESVFDLSMAVSASAEISLSPVPADMLSLIRSWNHEFTSLLGQSVVRLTESGNVRHDREQVRFRPPIERPGKIICLAGNYREHIVESGFVAPEESAVITQQLFLKPATALIGDRDDILINNQNITVGWETELAVVIGKRGRNIQAENAYDHVFGYMILNDVSERGLNSRIEKRTKREMDRFFDWLAGKWFDGFAPSGPWIVTADEIEDPHNLDIKLTLNGQVRQLGNTRDMIFRIPEQLAYISSIMTLEPGDIISTGTPVGAGVGGSASLQDGDEMVCEISEIGILRNKVRRAN